MLIHELERHEQEMRFPKPCLGSVWASVMVRSTSREKNREQSNAP
jgi:hypothetical protein